ncbi:nucleotidyltransferase domain-containing protein [Asanoa sp. NPDC049573]|uniref:nucleotidyltransferase domain-containing protein n=1 Tax=Asanoa sp. NPDC049573 TaxID=3155396 RepID=UPI00341AE267
MSLLLMGVVGSTAYGLAGPGSDVDRLGIFAVPTIELHGLAQHTETRVSHEPDVTVHEAAKFCRLALAGNPTVTELLWLPSRLYETRTPLGDELIAIRDRFLSARRVREAYLGYATKQFRLLSNRAPGYDKRVAKHARHLMRLCHQGLHAYRTGEILVPLDDPRAFLEFGERVAAGDLDVARAMLAAHEDAFAAASPAVPEQPDVPAVEDWLRAVRREFYASPGVTNPVS